MVSALLHSGATMACPHGGRAYPVVPNPRVHVGSQPTITWASPFVVTGCTLPPPPSGFPCVGVTWLTASTRVTSGGVPLLLTSSARVGVPTGAALTVLQAEGRVTAQ